MRKTTKSERIERRGASLLAVASLALALAAFGCTINRFRGNGEPTSAMPSYGQPNQSVTPGSSSGTEGSPPMASSYTGLTRVDTDRLATLAAQQGFRGRVLGRVNPGHTQMMAAAPLTGQVIPPAMIVNPQLTVNPSVSSPTGVEAFGVVTPTVNTTNTTVAAPLAATAAKAPVATSATPAARATVARASAKTASMRRATPGIAVAPVEIQTSSQGQVIVSNMNAAPTISVKP